MSASVGRTRKQKYSDGLTPPGRSPPETFQLELVVSAREFAIVACNSGKRPIASSSNRISPGSCNQFVVISHSQVLGHHRTRLRYAQGNIGLSGAPGFRYSVRVVWVLSGLMPAVRAFPPASVQPDLAQRRWPQRARPSHSFARGTRLRAGNRAASQVAAIASAPTWSNPTGLTQTKLRRVSSAGESDANARTLTGACTGGTHRPKLDASAGMDSSAGLSAKRDSDSSGVACGHI